MYIYKGLHVQACRYPLGAEEANTTVTSSILKDLAVCISLASWQHLSIIGQQWHLGQTNLQTSSCQNVQASMKKLLIPGNVSTMLLQKKCTKQLIT